MPCDSEFSLGELNFKYCFLLCLDTLRSMLKQSFQILNHIYYNFTWIMAYIFLNETNEKMICVFRIYHSG